MSSLSKRISESLEAGLDYVLVSQSADGSWTDWGSLPPGESRAWTTAFVGYKIGKLSGELKSKSQHARRAASEWLLTAKNSDGGWAYNERVASDADSTAYAILFLHSEGKSVAEESYDCLKEFRCEDGGFATYRGDGHITSWVVSHPDVTPVVLLAMLTKYSREDSLVEDGISYVLKTGGSGIWNSFWWRSSLYGTVENLRFLRKTGLRFETGRTTEALARMTPGNAFEMGLLLLASLYANPERGQSAALKLSQALLEQQQSNGSWESQPILRITNTNCFMPWEVPDSGLLFRDPNRLFTSSIALEALSGCKDLI